MNADEQFEQLKKLLALKRHEQPPPGYFNRLPGHIMSRIEETQENSRPWILRFFAELQTKPAFASAFGVAACALILGGIYFANQSGGSMNANGTEIFSTTETLAVNPSTSFPAPGVAQLVDANAPSTNPVVSIPGIDRFFDGTLISSSAQPVRIQINR